MTLGREVGPPDEHVVDSLGNRQMGRREASAIIAVVSTTAVAAGVAGVKIAINTATRNAYPPGKTRIKTIADVRPARGKRGRACFVFGGLGRQDADDITRVYAEAVRDAPDAPTRFGSIIIPNQGISTDEIAVCMDEYVEDDEEFDIFGHSMGWFTGLKASLAMRNRRRMRILTALSSPTDIDDIYKKREVEIAVRTGFRGDIAEKTAFNVLNDHTSDRPGILGKVFDIGSRAWRNAQQGVSPAVYMDQLTAVYYERAADHMGQLAAHGMITDESEVRYCKTLRDGTVIPNQACNSCEHASETVGARFTPSEFVGGHADVRAACKQMRQDGLI